MLVRLTVIVVSHHANIISGSRRRQLRRSSCTHSYCAPSGAGRVPLGFIQALP